MSRWQGGLAAAVITLVACVLVILDVTDAGLRRWMDGHALTADTIAGLLEFRTYTIMLLSAAPVLIDAPLPRNFLEHAQQLDGETARALSVLASKPGQADSPAARLDDAVQALKSASTPLLANLKPEARSAVRGDDPT
jgi:hypothetical protein